MGWAQDVSVLEAKAPVQQDGFNCSAHTMYRLVGIVGSKHRDLIVGGGTRLLQAHFDRLRVQISAH